MRSLVPLSARAATWVIGPSFLFVVYYAFQYVQVFDVAGYWLGVTSASGIFLFISAASCALAAAWEGNRARRGRLHEFPAARSPWAMLLQQLWPVLLMGLLLQLAGLFLVARTTFGTPGFPHGGILITYATVLVFHTMLGYCLGRFFPVPIAAPAAVVLSYVWMGFTGASPVLELRYLAGLSFYGCCAPDLTLHDAAIWAALVFNSVGAAALAVGSITGWRLLKVPVARLRAGILVAVVGVAAGGAFIIAMPLGPIPTTPRSASELRCEGNAPVLCLFPEQWAIHPEAVSVVESAYRDLTATGLTMPPRAEASAEESSDDVLRIALPPYATDSDLARSVASALLPLDPFESCGADPIERYEVFEMMRAWLISKVDDRSPVAGLSPPETIEALERLRQLPSAEQLAWFDGNMEALNDCDVRLQMEPQ